jgi:CRISPR-associated endonuclease/helicase Cas3
MAIDFQAAFSALTAPAKLGVLQGEPPAGRAPFRWQQRLFDWFARNEMPDACDIPTGLGKTSVMAIWLAALDVTNPEGLPRRLVYVVDRRAVVDQATAEANLLADNLGDGMEPDSSAAIMSLREQLGLRPGQRLPVSTLRGKLADNRVWLDDPTAPAIIVGTVDMIASRLLFSGYGVSPKMRPYHAGFLGADALIVLDEAHLVPPFQALIEQVKEWPVTDAMDSFTVPAMRTMALSATGRGTNGEIFKLEDEDIEQDELVSRRVNAQKWITLEDEVATGDLAEAMAKRAIERAGDQHRVLVFCNSRKIAQGVHDRLEKALGKKAKGGINLELIVGARRVREREQLVESLVFRRFARTLKNDEVAEGPAFLVATSAGEVGVDIDADHMVCDLVAWERMVQRLGRVNRRGEFPASRVDVFPAASEKDREAEAAIGKRELERWRAPFESDAWRKQDDRLDGSPGALRRLRANSDFRVRSDEATSGEPLRPALKPGLVDAWAMTSLDQHPGRPEVAPWIRGWPDEEEASQTEVLWRRLLPIRKNESAAPAKRELDAFFDAAPPHLSEVLETETWRVVEMLRARAKALLKRTDDDVEDDDVSEPEVEAGAEPDAAAAVSSAPLTGRTIVAVTLTYDGSVEVSIRLDEFQNRDRLERQLAGRRVVLDARIGGLATSGLLDPKKDEAPATLDDWRAGSDGIRLWNDDWLRSIGFRVREARTDSAEENWKVVYRRFVDAASEEADDTGEDIEWRVEDWVGRRPADNEPALVRYEQKLTCHQKRAAYWAGRFADTLRLPADLREMLVVAALCHDSGKARPIWQRYAGRPPVPLAKFATWANPRLLKVGDGTYRHEFGSLHDAAKAFEALPPPLRRLGRHLIAAHHGQGRPWSFAYDDSCSVAESMAHAQETVRNFAALQAEWGPWGLAWWESLLRAADVMASRENPQETA